MFARTHHEACRVHRFWQAEDEKVGQAVHKPGGQEQAFAGASVMSAKGHKRTFAPRNYSSVRVALKCETAAINNRSVVIAETKQ
jgi:uncharacterized protein (DUF3084 family)